MNTDKETKCGLVALLGAPNAGKSTLVNALTGEDIAVVTHKAQTTRTPLRGIFQENGSQVILIDTPGILRPRTSLEKAMMHAAWGSVTEADAVLLIVDAARREAVQEIPNLLQRVQNEAAPNIPIILVLNKVDRVTKPRLLTLAEEAKDYAPFESIFMISAETGDGVQDLRRKLAHIVPAGPHLFGEDEITDTPMRLLAAEMTRGHILRQLHEEIPYGCAVETESWVAGTEKQKCAIHQVIYVLRESHKRMMIGSGGSRIKAIGQAARQDIEAMTGEPVHLKLFVKVKPDWPESPHQYAVWNTER